MRIRRTKPSIAQQQQFRPGSGLWLSRRGCSTDPFARCVLLCCCCVLWATIMLLCYYATMRHRHRRLASRSSGHCERQQQPPPADEAEEEGTPSCNLLIIILGPAAAAAAAAAVRHLQGPDSASLASSHSRRCVDWAWSLARSGSVCICAMWHTECMYMCRMHAVVD